MDSDAIKAELADLRGQLLATQAAVRALILCAPDPLATAARVQAQVELLMAISLASPAGNDAHIASMQAAQDWLLPGPADLRRR
jgi:hypothetical protein